MKMLPVVFTRSNSAHETEDQLERKVANARKSGYKAAGLPARISSFSPRDDRLLPYPPPEMVFRSARRGTDNEGSCCSSPSSVSSVSSPSPSDDTASLNSPQPATPVSGTPATELLTSLNLLQYLTKLTGAGYEYVEDLRGVGKQELLDIGFLPGHAQRLMNAVLESKTPVSVPASPSPSPSPPCFSSPAQPHPSFPQVSPVRQPSVALFKLLGI